MQPNPYNYPQNSHSTNQFHPSQAPTYPVHHNQYPHQNNYQETDAVPLNQYNHPPPNQFYGNPNQNNFKMDAISMNHNAQAGMMQNIRQQGLESPSDDQFVPADFSEKNTRLGFIKKTFGILSVQLLITAIFCIIPFVSEPIRIFMVTHWYITIICSVLAMIILYVTVYTKAGRKVPINYIMLFTFTLLESYVVAFVGARYEPSTVLLAAGLTTAMVIGLSLYAAFTKTDFTKCGGFLTICLVVLITGGILAFFFRNKILNLVLSVLGVIIFGIYLIFDIQLLMGNKKNKFSKDDYVLAAMMIYIDIIQIFIYLIQIIGAARS